MTDTISKFIIEFGSNSLTITFKDRDGQEVSYQALPQADMSAATRLEFLSSVKKWVDDSSDYYTDIDISVQSHVIPLEQYLAAMHQDQCSCAP